MHRRAIENDEERHYLRAQRTIGCSDNECRNLISVSDGRMGSVIAKVFTAKLGRADRRQADFEVPENQAVAANDQFARAGS